MKKLGVVGSGSMGNGIGQTAALNGYDVILYDVAEAQLAKARQSIATSLRKRVEKGRMAQEEMDRALAAIRCSVDLAELADRDVIVEAVVEKVEIKQKVFSQLEDLVGADCLLGTNTSSLSLAEIASGMKDPTRLVGIHFFNPVPAMKLVEIVRTALVRRSVAEQAKAFAESLGKVTIQAPDSPGFVVNYLQYPFRLNAMRMVEKGIATPEDIDTAAKLGLGHPMGPLELQDMVGLDVTYYATSSIYEKTHDPAMEPPEILRRMVEEGKLGRKSGQGFYDYREKK
ncbi:3-hydroxyacyl-CoA dehydrogenase family protein [Desulfosporosinus sp. PR]|uniref:3-hydroxyacyl-CoA dehydrogenase family protein n=1 Tax=Candidatus Desulfosporosinus nitrosoreducens TaxID=3401928 RepID=UPI0027F3A35B|nr:3-hydroxyacyl-CoA dehydrogenase family protein [Desulfosporosinus sp. PR]MDQ7096519.1 3-hydroxyacyl-CoA dehydrogenase family protein [Desulfosporosinus sp. PR]